MSAGSWQLVNDARALELEGLLKSSDSWKVALFTVSIPTSSTTYSALSNEVGTTNTGYSTGGCAVTPVIGGTAPTATWYFSTNPSWTAGSANLAAVSAVLYDTTSGDILAVLLLDSGGATVTTTSGQTLTIADSSSNPVVTFN